MSLLVKSLGARKDWLHVGQRNTTRISLSSNRKYPAPAGGFGKISLSGLSCTVTFKARRIFQPSASQAPREERGCVSAPRGAGLQKRPEQGAGLRQRPEQ